MPQRILYPWQFLPASQVNIGLIGTSLPFPPIKDKNKKACPPHPKNTLPTCVRLKGLEPPRREASDPKSDVATNYTTAAFHVSRRKGKKKNRASQIFPDLSRKFTCRETLSQNNKSGEKPPNKLSPLPNNFLYPDYLRIPNSLMIARYLSMSTRTK